MMENKIEASQIKYHFFENGILLDDSSSQIRKKAFELWHTEWTSIYKELGSNKLPATEDFLSYHLVNCLFLNGEIVGLSGHRFINLKDPLSRDTEFVRSLGESFIEKIQGMGLNRLLTYESLLVSPKYRKSSFPVPVSKVLLHMANRIFSNTPADAIVAAGRCDYKISEMCERVGWETIEREKQFRVFLCDLIIWRKKNVFYPDFPDWQMAKALWEAGVGHFNQTYISQTVLPQQDPHESTQVAV